MTFKCVCSIEALAEVGGERGADSVDPERLSGHPCKAADVIDFSAKIFFCAQ